MRHVLGALAFLMLAGPVMAGPQTFEVAFAADLSTMSIHATAVIDGEDAAAMRQAMDEQAGDRDGVVTASEVTAFVDAFHSMLTSGLEQDVKSSTHLDGKAPTHTGVEGLLFTGAEGAVTSQEAATMSVTVNLRFAPVGNDTHLLVLTGDNEETNGTYTFHAPAGHRFGAITGMPGHTLAANRTLLSFVGETTDKATLLIEPIPAKSSPMPAAGMMVVALLGLAVARRP